MIARCEKSPPIGAEVVDKQVQRIGKIQDVFGPVKEPYVSIKPFDGVDLKKIIGQQVYLYRKQAKKRR